MKCTLCDTEHAEVYVHGRCHPKAATWVVLTEHEAQVVCAWCEKLVIVLPLAPAA